MAKAKLTLTANPSFKADVAIPVPGAGTTDVNFTFKYRDRDAYKEFIERMKDLEDVNLVMEMASGWELSEPFDEENVAKLVKVYIGAPLAILQKYVAEQTGTGHRVKNS